MFEIPESACEFISHHIDSLGNLEALLLFKRSPEKIWSAESMSRELRVELSWSVKQMEWLKSKSFIREVSANCFQYNEMNENAARITELELVYAEKRITVINLISERFIRLREFASAFVIRKEKKDVG
jgi:hypothetical protein